MDMKIFNNMDTYFDVYACLAQKPRAKNELQDFLLNKGKPKSTVKTHVAKAEKGDLGFVTNNNGQLRFETEQFKEMILSILVDTFISKISLPMQPVPEIGSISGA